MKKHWHELTSQETTSLLQSDAVTGLSTASAAERLATHGYNELKEKALEPLWQKFINQFKDFLVLILIAASLISVLVGEIADSVVIIAIVLLNACLGVFQEAKAEKALAALKEMSAPTTKVLRDGETTVLPSRELVPGDIVLLEAGDYLPGDLRIIESFNLKVEEASLTGESVPVDKNTETAATDAALADRHNMGFMSTVVTYGRGKGIIVNTGMNTEIGKIAEMLQTVETENSPLQKKLAEFGHLLGYLCLVVCAAVFGMGIYNSYSDGILEFAEVQLMLMTAISLAVAAIPEGLPTVVTIVLALGMQRMAKKRAIMKKLHAVETLGSISVICSDKTGTLTQNQMTVVKCYTLDKMYAVSGEGYTPAGDFQQQDTPVAISAEQDLTRLLQGAALCNDAQLKQTADQAWHIVGDPTEGALVVAAEKGGYHQQTLTAGYPRLQELPFDSVRKMMTTFHQVDGELLAFTKGAPDVLISRCTHIVVNGAIQLLTPAVRLAVDAANREMASQALRVLAVAYRRWAELPAVAAPPTVENELVFIGLLGMIDPPRAEVREAVNTCRNAGIRPIMITGDHPDTALAIAKDLGLATGDDQAIVGTQLDTLSKNDLQNLVQSASVFARVSPEHKMSIIEALRSNHQIVAMTGDGVNDAPALKKADIGVAMGITGTDVTKETADMVVADDNFATIVAAVEEGRVIYANIRKFVYFLLSCNAAEILVIFFAIALGWPIPLLPIQLLWVNLVTDAFPALALGVEKSEPNVMNIKPRDPAEPLLTRNFQIMIAMQSLSMAVTVLGAFYYGLHAYHGDLGIARTFAFITLITTQVMCAYAARSEYYSVFQLGFFSNKYLNAGVALSLALLLVSVYGPLHIVFKTIEPSFHHWLLFLLLTPIPFFTTELTKWVLRKTGN
ncbi:cation-translocating P-type ATPase [Sporomusa termitida]|uniref:P-type Ca(2+) transporter n=1 Tax=Sporomusa termitida TaxID=2377 RepID=A0A517E0Y1_9FIRM|nr:cation-translocating P-type ATPase [Sporomusa termitida]QDR83156.1 Calcium-transporting ATPase 1 [Sporomusa termitida]